MRTVAPARLASSASPIRKIELLGIVTIVQTYEDIRTHARFLLSTTSTYYNNTSVWHCMISQIRTPAWKCGIYYHLFPLRIEMIHSRTCICYVCHRYTSECLVDAFQRLSSLKATSSPGWGVLSRCWYPWTPWFWFPYLHLGSCVSQAPNNKL